MENIVLNNIDYHDIKHLSIKEKEKLAEKVREIIIKDVLNNGGHLSSNLGVVELTISLFDVFDPEIDDIIFDVSHQCYTYKILTNRNLALLRLKGGVNGFTNIDESKYDKTSAGHSGTAISIGLGLATAKKLSKNNTSQTVIVIGDSSIANGISFEALNTACDSQYGKIIVVLNDNNMSISSPKGAISHILEKFRVSFFYQNNAELFKKIFDRKYLSWFYKFTQNIKQHFKQLFLGTNIFEQYGFTYLGPISGHDFKKLDKFFTKAKIISKSTILHVRTIKGKGYPEAENDKFGYYHGLSKPKLHVANQVSLSKIAGNSILEILKNDSKAVLICPAMVIGSCLEECFKQFPERCFDPGIVEEHTLAMLAGFALKGYHPILDIYSCFLQRGYDILVSELSYMRLSCLIVVDRSGLVGEDGSSHMGLEDLDMEVSLPNSKIYQPSNSDEIYSSIVNYKFDSNCPFFVRIEKDLTSSNYSLKDIVAYQLIDKKATRCLICLSLEAKKLIERLENEEIDIIYLKQIKPFPHQLDSFINRHEEVILFDTSSYHFKYYMLGILNSIGFYKKVSCYTLDTKHIEFMSKQEQLEDNKLDYLSVYNKLTNNK